MQFLVERARHIFMERDGFAYDEVNAAFVAGSDDLVDAAARIAAVRTIRKTREFRSAGDFVQAYSQNFGKGRSARESWAQPAVRTELFREGAERKLHTAAHRAAREAEQHKRAGRYKEALQGIAGLRPEVDDFFDHVMVMADRK